MKILILLPLAVLICATMLSVMGVGSDLGAPSGGYLVDGRGNINGDEGWYDDTGHLVCYDNGTAAGEAGIVGTPSYTHSHPFWDNTTSGGSTFDMYADPSGTDLQKGDLFDITGTLGLIGIVLAVMALGCIVGIRVVGSGTSSTSVSTVIIGTAFLSLWGVFSVFGYPLIGTIPLFGGMLYFILTAMYTVGVIQAFSGMGGED